MRGSQKVDWIFLLLVLIMIEFAAATIYSDDGEDGEESNFTEEEAGLFIIIFKTAIGLLHEKAAMS